MEKTWEQLSPVEKRDELVARWLEPEGIEFDSPQAGEKYRASVTRILDAVRLEKLPDRVPVMPSVGMFPARYAGFTPQDVMYDYEKAFTAYEKYVRDFDPDVQVGMASPTPGRVYDIMDYKLYAWPGHGLPPQQSFQCIEGEYVYAGEYDALIRDPSDFFATVYLPRVFGALEPWRMLPNLTHIQEIPHVGPNLAFFGRPEVQDAYRRLFEAGSEALKWAGYVGAFDKKLKAAGYPGFAAGYSKAPFDVVGDTLRGTRGIMLDMYRQPEKLLEALDALVPVMINMGAAAARRAGKPGIMIPLHKGADGFLSAMQFEKFYWPSFRKLVLGLIEEGCIPCSFAEGGFNTRLEYLADFPRGTTIWYFDTTDMARAKEVLGNVACIGGNVPVSLLTVGAPQDVAGCVRRLIDTAGKGGGYIMTNGAVLDDARPENVRAMIETARQYGVYRR